jgi:hypothetical protein
LGLRQQQPVSHQGSRFRLAPDRQEIGRQVIVHQTRFAVAIVISGSIMVMISIGCCDLVNMIIVMDMILRRREHPVVLTHMLRPYGTRHYESAQ